jgi:hypothetical protein
MYLTKTEAPSGQLFDGTNVQQFGTSSNAEADFVIKVKGTVLNPAGPAGESFALAVSKAAFHEAAVPAASMTCLPQGTVKAGSPFTLLCTPTVSGELPMFNVSAAFDSGETIGFGTIDPETPGPIQPHTVQMKAATSPGTATYQVTLSGDAFGESFKSKVTVEVPVTGTGPANICQTGFTPPASPIDLPAGTLSGSFLLSVGSKCDWVASPHGAVLFSPMSGTGTTTINFQFPPLPKGAPPMPPQTVAIDFTVLNVPLNNPPGTGGFATVVEIRYALVPCSFGLTASNPVPSGPQSLGSVFVSVSNGCAWAASSGSAWITLKNTSGVGSGTVNFTVEQNPSSQQRGGAVLVNGNLVTIVQQGSSCTVTLGSTAITANFDTTLAAIIEVKTPDYCVWRALPSSSWIHAANGSPGSGNGRFSFSVDKNVSNAIRKGSITVGNAQVEVTQNAAPCDLVIEPGVINIDAAGGATQGLVHAPSGCPWTIGNATKAFVTLPASRNRTGSSLIDVTVARNMTGAEQTASFTVGPKKFVVWQAPFIVADRAVNVPAVAVGHSIHIAGSGAWQVFPQQGTTWITVTKGSDSLLNFHVTANDRPGERKAKLFVASPTDPNHFFITIEVTQAGRQ